jgi:hypothetical protein
MFDLRQNTFYKRQISDEIHNQVEINVLYNNDLLW